MSQLLGRRSEREALEQLLADALAGRSAVVVVRGEAGIGKSALLEHVRTTATSSGFQVASSVGSESETQFAFAGLHQLCAPLLDRLSALPDPQQAALGVTFGLRDGAVPDPFLVGLAALNLLAEVAEEGPLLCLVDDAQWLDQASAQVLTFVARRLTAERLALVFGLRDPSESGTHSFAGLPELILGGLGDTDARALLAAAVSTPLDPGVRERIVAEARGNPLALLELPQSTSATGLAGGFELPNVVSIPRRIEESLRRRSGSLPTETQQLLLAAAAESTGDVALLWRAVEKLGITREAAGLAEGAGLLEIDTRVRFRHPLVRSAVYQAADPASRRRTHGALAEATDKETDPDRRAWHRARSVLGPDEETAADLVRSADRARARGGLAAAAAFLQQATDLTPDPATRAARALEAAQAKHEAGAPDDALKLLEMATRGPLDALQHARLKLLRAQIGFRTTRGSEVPEMFLAAATTLAPLDAALSRETYLHALQAAITGGDSVRDVAVAAQAAPPPPGPAGPADLLLDGLVTSQVHGYAAGVHGLRRALEAFRDEEPTTDADGDSGQWLWLAGRTAATLFEDDLVYVLADRHVRQAREAGALATLPAALLLQSITLVFSGELARAAELADEGTGITRATGAVPLLHAQLNVAGWRGRQAEASTILATIDGAASGGRHDTEISMAQYAWAVLQNALGNYAAAQDAAAQAVASDELTHTNVALPELIEAAARSGQTARAAAALEELSARASASGTQWALGLVSSARALTSTGPAAEDHYREAITQLRDCRMASYLARTHLVYGEWLRRQGRRLDAREQLRTAHDRLTAMGAEAFADRAARELRATGANPRKRTSQPTDGLTAQELHISRLVATGATSREVAAQLFLSPRTIEAHLRNIFRKLDIDSRRQLKELNLP